MWSPKTTMPARGGGLAGIIIEGLIFGGDDQPFVKTREEEKVLTITSVFNHC